MRWENILLNLGDQVNKEFQCFVQLIICNCCSRVLISKLMKRSRPLSLYWFSSTQVMLWNSVKLFLLYVLLNDRGTIPCKHTFIKLNGLNPDLNESTIMTDYDNTALSAFQVVYSNQIQHGCLFSLSRCTWWRLQQSANIQQGYMSDEDLVLQTLQLPRLALVSDGVPTLNNPTEFLF